MNDLAQLDETQRELARHLAVTERQLNAAVRRVGGVGCSAEITLMPDLGLPRSVARAQGGFFTGTLVRWDCPVPFVPVDTTVNVCAVGVYRLSDDGDAAAVARRIAQIEEKCRRGDCSYVWNFADGNHFAILAEAGEDGPLPPGRYLVLHASAGEFKGQHNGLYPAKDNWFAGRIESVRDDATGRSLRYLAGDAAERFFRIADWLVPFNRSRLRYFASEMAGGGETEVFYQPHYGMPDAQSVAIGCQWLKPGALSLLLTRPGEPLLWVEPTRGGGNEIRLRGEPHLLQPHGFGVEVAGGLKLDYAADGLVANGRPLGHEKTFKTVAGLGIRGHGESADATARRILARCPGRVTGRLHPLFSYSAETKN